MGANFAAGFVAGSLAAGATCPLDVAKTRRQIEVCVLLNTLYINAPFSSAACSVCGILALLHCCLLSFLVSHSILLISCF